MLGLRWVEANKIDLPLGWKKGHVQRPLPVLTIFAARVFVENTRYRSDIHPRRAWDGGRWTEPGTAPPEK